MADDRAKLLAKFIEPLRVKPGSKVKLAKDFDPGYKASFLKKKDGAAILQAGSRAARRIPGPAGRPGHLGGAGVPAGAGRRAARTARSDT